MLLNAGMRAGDYSPMDVARHQLLRQQIAAAKRRAEQASLRSRVAMQRMLVLREQSRHQIMKLLDRKD